MQNSSQRIDTIAEVSAAGAGQSLEIDRELVFTKAHGGPHGFDALGRDAVETGLSNLCDQPVSTQLGDQSWLRKSEHRDKWSFCLKAASMRAAQERP
jgi:hypothetical protein